MTERIWGSTLPYRFVKCKLTYSQSCIYDHNLLSYCGMHYKLFSIRRGPPIQSLIHSPLHLRKVNLHYFLFLLVNRHDLIPNPMSPDYDSDEDPPCLPGANSGSDSEEDEKSGRPAAKTLRPGAGDLNTFSCNFSILLYSHFIRGSMG